MVCYTLLPKMDLVCGSDKYRPNMMHVLLTKDNIVASDANVIVVHSTPRFFEPDFIKDIPEEGILIHRDVWKRLRKTRALSFKIHPKMNLIEVSVFGSEYPEWFSYAVRGDVKSKNKLLYPNWELVFASHSVHSTEKTSFRPRFLEIVSEAMGGDNEVILTFDNPMKGILVTKRTELDLAPELRSKAIVMPINIDQY